MNIYTDESGVFDSINNRYYVFAGCVFLSKEQRDIGVRKYIHVESTVRESYPQLRAGELKASRLSNGLKGKLFRSLNGVLKFAVIINQNRVNSEIFNHKKSKQRYLDYAYKIGVKRFMENLISQGIIVADEVRTIHFLVDEHSTATNGRYELRESLEEEFIRGTFNAKWDKFFPPIFPMANGVNLSYCNSSKQALIRVADIIANRVYYHAIKEETNKISDKIFITRLP